MLFDKKNFPESKYMYDDGDNLLTQCTYDKDNTYKNDIYLHFQNDGVYISKKLADKLAANPKTLKGKYLEFDLFIPNSYIYGKVQCGWKGSEPVDVYSPTCVLQKVKLPIAGVLKDSSFGVYCINPEVIYIDKSIYSKYISQYKFTETPTVYIGDYEYTKYSINKVPDFPVIETFEYSEWHPNAYTVTIDSPAYINDVSKEIEKIGLAVHSAYFDYDAFLASTKAIQNSFSTFVKSILIVLIIIYLMILKVGKKDIDEINSFFKQLGLNKKDINSIWLKVYLYRCVFLQITIIILIYSLSIIFNGLNLGATKISYQSILASLLLTLGVQFIFPIFIYLKEAIE